jgi:hypothetical protein
MGFATEPQLGLAMIERAVAAKVPFMWVAADSVYGVGEIKDRQERARPRPQRAPLLARLAPPRLAGDVGLRHAGRDSVPGERAHAGKNPDPARSKAPDLIRWSVQELRRITGRLASDASSPPTSSPAPSGIAPIRPPHNAHIWCKECNYNYSL